MPGQCLPMGTDDMGVSGALSNYVGLLRRRTMFLSPHTRQDYTEQPYVAHRTWWWGGEFGGWGSAASAVCATRKLESGEELERAHFTLSVPGDSLADLSATASGGTSSAASGSPMRGLHHDLGKPMAASGGLRPAAEAVRNHHQMRPPRRNCNRETRRIH